MTSHLVSIIIPAYNCCKVLLETLNSVASQTYRPLEVVLIDDGSVDDSGEVFGKWSRDLQQGECIATQGHRLSRVGAAAARNWGVAHCTGQFVQFLDSDDLLGQEKIEKQVRAGIRYPNKILVGPWQWLKVTTQGSQIEEPIERLNVGEDLLDQWLEGKFCATASLLWPRSVLNAVGPWDEILTADQDGDMFLRAITSGIEFLYVPDAMAYYRTTAGRILSVAKRRTLDSFQSRIRVLDKLHAALLAGGALERYSPQLGFRYCCLARSYAVLDCSEVEECFRRGLSLTGGRIPEGVLHGAFVRVLGLRTKERIARLWHSIGRLW